MFSDCSKIMRLGLCFLAIFPLISAASPAWPDIIPQEPMVGIHFATDYGTSTVLYPNGTFQNLAFVRGDKAYQDWIDLSMRSAMQSYNPWSELGAQLCPEARNHEHKPSETFFSISNLLKVLFPQYYTDTPSEDRSDAESTEHQTLLEKNTPLRELLEAVKEDTEMKLGQPINRVVVSYPGFFDDNFVRRLEHTLQNLSLLDDGCHASSRSPVAALIAHRPMEFDLGFLTRVLDFIHGPFGIENVVHIENTESHLIMTPFQFFAGETSAWAIRSFRDLTVLQKNKTHRTPTDGIKSGPEVEKQLNITAEDAFWAAAQACLDYFFDIDAKEHVQPHSTYRLILTGTQSHDPKLLAALKNTHMVEALIPPNRPFALYVHRPQEIISERWAARRRPFTCILEQDYADWGLWYEYYDELVQSIRDETRDFSADIDPIFAASRGAALLSLESHLIPCEYKCDMVRCKERQLWEDENAWVYQRGVRERRGQGKVAEL